MPPFKDSGKRKAYAAEYYQKHRGKILRELKLQREEQKHAAGVPTTVPELQPEDHRSPVSGLHKADSS